MVGVLSELSTSYKEKTQLYCARALCNLACHHGSEKSLVDGGGVSALMMIALVRKSGDVEGQSPRHQRKHMKIRKLVIIMIKLKPVEKGVILWAEIQGPIGVHISA